MSSRSLNLPNILTSGRFVLSPFLAACLIREASDPRWGRTALIIFIACAVSDLVDGRLARRLGTDNLCGKRLDALADIVLLLPALTLLAHRGALPLALPLAASAAFFLFAKNVLWTANNPAPKYMATNTMGHLGGIGNWIAVGAATVAADPLAAETYPGLAYMIGTVAALLNASAVVMHLSSGERRKRHPVPGYP